MLNNMIKHSVRSFKREKKYTLINILGLSTGIACSLLIALYVINEASYDRYNIKKDRIFRAILNGKIGEEEVIISRSAAIMGPTMLKEFPEVESFLRLSGGGPTAIEYNNRTFVEDNWIEADSSFFNFFTIPVLKGDRNNLLNAPRKVVLSAAAANKIFGNMDPVGKTIKIGIDSARYSVSGVMADTPENSHFSADLISSFMTNPRSKDQIWLNNSFSTYLLLKPNSSSSAVDKKLPELMNKYVGPEIQKFMGLSASDFAAKGNKYRFYLQNLKDIHLDTSIQQHFKNATDPKYLRIFGSIAILIILIAAINFMNLSTAQSSMRSKEIGIKKISGSGKGLLISQFFTETFIISFISLIVAIFFIKATLPMFNNLLGTKLALNLFANWYNLPILIVFSVFVGILAGSYPAFFLSSFSPYSILKGNAKKSMKNGALRRVLVVFQFAVSILLIVGTIVMYKQIKFMLGKDVGFNKEQLLVIDRADALGSRIKSFKDAVKMLPGVTNIASSTDVPGGNNSNNGYIMEGRKDESFQLQTNFVDYSFLDTYGMKLASGRFFNESFTADKEACLLNESAVKSFSISDPESTRFFVPGDESRSKHMPVIGVVKNFNFESLHKSIGPYILRFQDDNQLWGYVTVRLLPQDISRTISSIETKWKEFVPDFPLQYYFIDARFDQMYIQEKQNAHMAVIFSILAIFIASLGLFGLTSFTVGQRTKEIGIRKAMGSSIAEVYITISKEIIILISVSALIACPVIYYVTGKWLQNFYYKISPGALTFLSGFLAALVIGVITISYHILKASRVNPAQSLKYE
jgi:putative ABC transport system permease protein